MSESTVVKTSPLSTDSGITPKHAGRSHSAALLGLPSGKVTSTRWLLGLPSVEGCEGWAPRPTCPRSVPGDPASLRDSLLVKQGPLSCRSLPGALRAEGLAGSWPRAGGPCPGSGLYFYRSSRGSGPRWPQPWRCLARPRVFLQPLRLLVAPALDSLHAQVTLLSGGLLRGVILS